MMNPIASDASIRHHPEAARDAGLRAVERSRQNPSIRGRVMECPETSMDVRRRVTIIALLLLTFASIASGQSAVPRLKVARFIDSTSIELADERTRSIVARGSRFGSWTLMEIVPGARPFAVLEDFQNRDGRMLFVDLSGVTT